jgi:hypothetical protein
MGGPGTSDAFEDVYIIVFGHGSGLLFIYACEYRADLPFTSCDHLCALVKLFVLVLLVLLLYLRISAFLRIFKSKFVKKVPVAGLGSVYGFLAKLS